MIEKLKKFLRITGTEKGELELREFKQILIISFIGIAVVLQVVFAVMFLRNLGWINGGGGISDKYDRNIAVLSLDQEITEPYVNTIIGQLNKIKEEKEKFPHLLIVINSPGGSPVAASELYHLLVDFQKEIPITVYVQNLAASGAYYVAVASKYDPKNPLSGIIAESNSMVGSIGVIMPHMVFSGAAEKIGVAEDDISVGRFKKPISLFKHTSEEDKQYLQSNLLEPVYHNFLQAVAEGRNMSLKEVEKYSEGRVFISTQVKGPLVDRISYISKVQEELKAAVEKRFPGEECGFSEIDLRGLPKSMFDVKISINTPSIGADIAQNASANTINLH